MIRRVNLTCEKCGESIENHPCSTDNNRGGKISVAPVEITSSEWLSSGVASAEFLIAKWEAKAEELEHMAAEYRQNLTGLVAMTLEKARAYRSCIEELRRHAEAANVRQPEDNGKVSGGCESE